MFYNKEDFKREFTSRFERQYGRNVAEGDITEHYMILGDMVRDYASVNWKKSKQAVAENQQKQLFYFSMEFLIGRLLTSNMMNLGIYDTVKEGLDELGIDLNELEDTETDAGLGNGGLGRLAACFLDSLATLDLPGHGNTIRYEYGLFKQKIIDNKQVETPDIWLKVGNPWEIRKAKHAVEVKFYGNLETHWKDDKTMEVKLVDPEIIKAVPYDVPVIGYHNQTVNTLRLWKAEASENMSPNTDFIKYISNVNRICQNVYPDDSTEDGRILRVKQEYFFVSAGLQALLNSHLDNYHTLENLPDKVVIQLNDTHPIMIIPELMRILMDEHNYSWDKAWDIVTRSVAYTNHTIMQEALEKWPVSMIQRLLPRIYLIVEEINRRFMLEVIEKTHDSELANRVSIIKDGQVHMSHMADATVYSINGVARIHTEILKNNVMKDFYYLYPDKFNNKTNGITHRRWLLYSDPGLAELLKKYIGTGFIRHPDQLENLLPYVDDVKLQEEFLKVKKENKERLKKYILKETGIEVDTNTIFDVQAKRLHAYKRQMLNCMNIIYLYQQIKSNPDFTMEPTTFIFAAKAAPAYVFAKKVIELINCVASVVNKDPQVSKFIKVVFIPNYCVSNAEIMLCAADVSEQISTAGTEASGTGNMKLMMNGAVTIGTLDGANVEIRERVGDDNIFIFGNTVEQLAELKSRGYNAFDYYHKDEDIRKVLDTLIDGTWHQDRNEFKSIYDELLYKNDEYFLLADFQMYKDTQRKINQLYKDNKALFTRMCLTNVAKSGYFSSDRTITNYNDDIWHLKPIEF